MVCPRRSPPGSTYPDRLVVAFTGDGDFQMTGQELGCALQTGAWPIVLVVNNRSYGTIRMHQERTYPGRVSFTEIVNPDFAAIARGLWRPWRAGHPHRRLPRRLRPCPRQPDRRAPRTRDRHREPHPAADSERHARRRPRRTGLMPDYRRILLTGAAGSLGSHLRRGLAPLAERIRLADVRDLGAAAPHEEIVAVRPLRQGRRARGHPGLRRHRAFRRPPARADVRGDRHRHAPRVLSHVRGRPPATARAGSSTPARSTPSASTRSKACRTPARPTGRTPSTA